MTDLLPQLESARKTVRKKIALYDNTRISAARSCLRYYYFSHIRHWRAEGKSLPLIFGGAWGNALDVVWRRHEELGDKKSRRNVIDEAYEAFCGKWMAEGGQDPEEMSPDDIEYAMPSTPMVGHEMLYHYVDRREQILCDPTFQLLAIERPFAIQMSPDDDTLFYVGRMDKEFLYRDKKQRKATDHKTTSAYKKKGPFQNNWVDSWAINAQMEGYLYSMRVEFPSERSPAVWVDGALVHKEVHDGFAMIPIERRDDALMAWLYDTHSWISQIEGNKAVLEERSKIDSPYLAAFPRNTNSCTNYGICQYFDLCRAVPNPAKLDKAPMGYIEHVWSPFNELKLQEIGLDPSNAE